MTGLQSGVRLNAVSECAVFGGERKARRFTVVQSSMDTRQITTQVPAALDTGRWIPADHRTVRREVRRSMLFKLQTEPSKAAAGVSRLRAAATDQTLATEERRELPTTSTAFGEVEAYRHAGNPQRRLQRESQSLIKVA